MEAKKATFVCVGLLVSCLANAALGSTQSQQLFLSTMGTLRNLDPSVATVNARILSSNRNRTSCGSAANGDGVAFYCKNDKTIYVSAKLLSTIEKGYGPSAVRYLAAHELAHGRQHSVTGFSKNLVWSSVIDELQADCIAGAYLRLAYGYTPESPQGDAVRQFAYNIGDHEYLSHDWHGNPRWRVAAVSRGMRTGSPARCLSSKRFNYGSLVETGADLLRKRRQK
jgi:uncharacterized protein